MRKKLHTTNETGIVHVAAEVPPRLILRGDFRPKDDEDDESHAPACVT